jgi:hypothetical protein
LRGRKHIKSLFPCFGKLMSLNIYLLRIQMGTSISNTCASQQSYFRYVNIYILFNLLYSQCFLFNHPTPLLHPVERVFIFVTSPLIHPTIDFLLRLPYPRRRPYQPPTSLSPAHLDLPLQCHLLLCHTCTLGTGPDAEYRVHTVDQLQG